MFRSIYLRFTPILLSVGFIASSVFADSAKLITCQELLTEHIRTRSELFASWSDFSLRMRNQPQEENMMVLVRADSSLISRSLEQIQNLGTQSGVLTELSSIVDGRLYYLIVSQPSTLVTAIHTLEEAFGNERLGFQILRPDSGLKVQSTLPSILVEAQEWLANLDEISRKKNARVTLFEPISGRLFFVLPEVEVDQLVIDQFDTPVRIQFSDQKALGLWLSSSASLAADRTMVFWNNHWIVSQELYAQIMAWNSSYVNLAPALAEAIAQLRKKNEVENVSPEDSVLTALLTAEPQLEIPDPSHWHDPVTASAEILKWLSAVSGIPSYRSGNLTDVFALSVKRFVKNKKQHQGLIRQLKALGFKGRDTTNARAGGASFQRLVKGWLILVNAVDKDNQIELSELEPNFSLTLSRMWKILGEQIAEE